MDISSNFIIILMQKMYTYFFYFFIYFFHCFIKMTKLFVFFSVHHLKNVIEENCHIPTNKQVLLISGGECLQESAKVCSYSSGTDTNPIYLFNRSFLERSEMPNIIVDFRFSNIGKCYYLKYLSQVPIVCISTRY